LKGVAANFGPQVHRKFLVREVVAQEGPVAAFTGTNEIELVDTGGHGARPREAADPIVGARALIGGVQTSVSRRLNPALAGYRGDCYAATAHNIVPERARLSGTLRAMQKSELFCGMKPTESPSLQHLFTV
jgi:metal-dependent amidase/aminoacylase/carboxypeptidase family protein